jgi:glycosyltransferase involved in cell wall biosynthesis
VRILQVISTFYPALAFGGPVKVAYDISKELARRGHEVEVFATNAYNQASNFKPKFKEQELAGFKVTYFNNLLRSGNIFVSPEMIAALRKRAKEFDVIHSHFGRQAHDIALSHYARKFAVPYVLQAHGSLPRIMTKQRSKWMYDVFFGYRLLRGASKVIALNRMEANQCKAFGVPDERIAIIPNGIDLMEYADLPPKGSFKKKFNIQDDKKVILYLGRIHKTKGIDYLINSYAHMIKTMKCNNTVLVIAGPDDGYLAEAKSLVDSSGTSDSVLFTGFIDSKDKLAALVDADLFVTPSFYGFPMTFLEACVFGIPIITTTLGDSLEWVDGNVGFATSSTPTDVATAMYKVISDVKLHAAFSRNCRKIVRSEFSLEKTVNILEQVYKSTVETNHSSLRK